MTNPRNSNGSARRALRRRVAAVRASCWMCGLSIDYELPARHPDSYELDELTPVSKGGDPFDPANVAAAHRRCNQWRSDKSVATVERTRAAAHATGCAWSSPSEFVAAMKGVPRSAKRDRDRAGRLAAGL